MILKLINNKNTYSFEVEDLNNGEKLFYHFQIPTADIEDGNYKMVLLDGDEIVTEEQVCIGVYNPQAIQYSRGENVYINAPIDANLEEVKEVEITSIETTVLPSEGYDGIKAVEVNAQPIYDEGYNVGNADGIEVGKTEQKALLEPITITENGTFSREDGYNEVVVEVPDLNGSYDEGYTDGYAEGEAKGVENAGNIIAETARVLDITENGIYLSQYSQDNDYVITAQPTGDDFYDYAEIIDIVYDTKVVPNIDTKLELWYKGDNTKIDDGWNVVIGSDIDNKDNSFNLTYYASQNEKMRARIGKSYLDFPINDSIWHHFEISREGVYVDGEYKGNIDVSNFAEQGSFYINATPYRTTQRKANGTFGMIKITTDGVENVIIPTADGFLNTNTNELLEIIKDGLYTYTEVELPTGEGNLIRTVNVNVIPKISVKDNSLKFGYSTFTEVPEWADFEGTIEMNDMFYGCRSLPTIPLIDTSNVTNMTSMFKSCSSLQTVSQFDTSKVNRMYEMFADCSSLTTIPEIDTSNVTNMQYMFFNCVNLTSLPKFNCTKVDSTGLNYYFRYDFLGDLTLLTDVGGWENLSCNWNDNYGLTRCPNLTYESCINILNGLADVTELGGRTLKVAQSFIDTVGDEIIIGTNKGWIITA